MKLFQEAQSLSSGQKEADEERYTTKTLPLNFLLLQKEDEKRITREGSILAGEGRVDIPS